MNDELCTGCSRKISSYRPLVEDLVQIPFTDLCLSVTHRGSVAIGTLSAPAFIHGSALWSRLEDDSGRSITIAVRNAMPPDCTARELFAQGSKIAVQEPYFLRYESDDNGEDVGLWVEDPCDVVFLTTDKHDLVKELDHARLRIEGNKLFATRDWGGAVSMYSGSILVAEYKLERLNSHEQDFFAERCSCMQDTRKNDGGAAFAFQLSRKMIVHGLVSALSNRSETYLRMQRISEALVDADAALRLNPVHVKSLVRKGRALQCIQSFDEAVRCFQDAGLDVAGRGRGLVVTPDVEAGELFLALGIVRVSATEKMKKLEEDTTNYELATHTQTMHDRSSDLKEQDDLLAKCVEDIAALKARRDEYQDQRKNIWKTENALPGELDKLKVDAEKSLYHAAPGIQDIRRGLNSVRRICRDHNISGVHGPLFELLDCDEKFFTAVEVTAGNSLYHVLVDTDDVATRITRYLSAEKGGRVTFIPLNQLRAPEITYPNSSDVVPLLKVLRFDSKFSAAFGQVFGRTIICRDLDAATSFARSAELDCITLDGDRVSKKGGMTEFIQLKEQELEDARNSIQERDQQINQVQAEQLKNDIADIKKPESSVINEKKKQLLAATHKQMEQERIMMKPIETGLNPEISQLKKMLIGKAVRMETEACLSTPLSANLVKRQQELEAQFSAIHLDSASTAESISDNIDKHAKQIQELKNVEDEFKAMGKNHTTAGGVGKKRKVDETDLAPDYDSEFYISELGKRRSVKEPLKFTKGRNVQHGNATARGASASTSATTSDSTSAFIAASTSKQEENDGPQSEEEEEEDFYILQELVALLCRQFQRVKTDATCLEANFLLQLIVELIRPEDLPRQKKNTCSLSCIGDAGFVFSSNIPLNDNQKNRCLSLWNEMVRSRSVRPARVAVADEVVLKMTLNLRNFPLLDAFSREDLARWVKSAASVEYVKSHFDKCLPPQTAKDLLFLTPPQVKLIKFTSAKLERVLIKLKSKITDINNLNLRNTVIAAFNNRERDIIEHSECQILSTFPNCKYIATVKDACVVCHSEVCERACICEWHGEECEVCRCHVAGGHGVLYGGVLVSREGRKRLRDKLLDKLTAFFEKQRRERVGEADPPVVQPARSPQPGHPPTPDDQEDALFTTLICIYDHRMNVNPI